MLIVFILQSIKDLFALGEAKFGTFNILVDHILKVWEDALRDACGGPLVSSETVFHSMSAHCDTFLQIATFGPVHKKNLRLDFKMCV